MKSLLAKVVLFLLVCLPLAAERPVSVSCQDGMFRVIVYKNMFEDGIFVKPEELLLGTGCLVNNERWDAYILQYPVTFCGIQIEVYEKHYIYKTYLYYFPIYYPYHRPPSQFPVSCTLPSLCLQKPRPVPDLRLQKNNEMHVMGMQPVISYYSPEL